MLRWYQESLKNKIYAEWAAGKPNVLAVLPTGGGKTRTFANIAGEEKGASCAIAHRNELVGQISVAYAAEGIRHRIIAPTKTVKNIVRMQIEETGRNYVDPSAPAAVAGVDTLIRREVKNPWFSQVGLWIQDEADHVLADNKWGKAANLFPNARGLGVTATPDRADGKGLGRHADGIFDALAIGAQMSELRGEGFLSDYRIVAPPSDLDISEVPLGSDGDFNAPKMRAAHKRSHLVGDVVEHYKKYAIGLQTIVFAYDVEAAKEMAGRFRAAGIKAESLSGETPTATREATVRLYRQGKLDVLVNVDLFDEGFDVPACSCVIMARATASFKKYCQQFGRALRPAPGKTHAIIIDCVGNVIRFAETRGLPDTPQAWTLDRRAKKSSASPNGLPLRICPSCTQPFERWLKECKWCGHYPEPASRAGPEFVEGDLTEMSPEAIARLRGLIDPSVAVPYGADAKIKGYLMKKSRERQDAQTSLRQAVAWYAGKHRALSRPDSEIYRRFYIEYGIDVMSAQALNRADAETLDARIRAGLLCDGIVITGEGA
ncbi:DEAD/DEAH box helicase [Marinobacter sp.]|uniref:DEAD/DEAH box helicase n=1 Tax=Marinobacter sp. TaxID=50741 RepID=UPI000C9108C4|nr:DEAD/DEAH box helicase [Marinobacter sp.]MAB53448.1 hypothetical protein [Marinobacter sp.]